MLISDRNKNAVERAVADIRRAMPIVVYDDTGNYSFCVAAEFADQEIISLYKLYSHEIYLLVTKQRLKYINGQEITQPSCRILSEDFRLAFPLHKQEVNVKDSNSIDSAIITLLKISMLLPTALMIDMHFTSKAEMLQFCNTHDYLSVNTSDIYHYKHDYRLREVCNSPLFLKDCEIVKILAFRPYSGSQEHYAIIIGSPDYDNPMIRIHSCCYTGDLLASLSCDCRDQLHGAIKFMANSQGGIILYLAQEGRGIGLVNKIRSYSLQICDGFDTVDANRIMGFEDDERDFTIAGKILDLLAITRFQLLTNNPEKADKMQNYGLQITSTTRLLAECNEHNCNYMKTKFSRLGHFKS